MDLISYLQHSWPTLLRLTAEHLALVGAAVGLAIVTGVPLGIVMTRHRWLATPLLTLATIVLTLPSIALFGLMIPIFARFGHALGYLPAVTAVFLYSLLPIMRNTYTALANVDPGIQEAGRGIGMTPWQRLRLVDLPLAVPVILGGVRTAVVMNIGVTTIAALIGAGGLGVLILQAISQSNMSKLAIGAALVSLLAIAADAGLQALQRALTPKGIRQS
ncbi:MULTISPECIES: ABC transporter permease [unclassified Cupriavidus]|uniref:ABC transporter permease n=1 Tax=Cupriavidus sp. H19C3 TaxID=3241603 RepID=UPI003BF8541B